MKRQPGLWPEACGASWMEVMLALAVMALLFLVIVPQIRWSHGEGMLPVLNNMRQLFLATQQMTLENEATGSPVRWTCSNSTPLTYRQWTNALANDYISEKELKKLLTLYSKRAFFGPKEIPDPYTVFAVTAADPAETLFMATKNWHGLQEANLSGEPYGKKGFAVIQKTGDAKILPPKQATNAKMVGTGGQHSYLPLKQD